MTACKRNLLGLAVAVGLLPGLALADKPTTVVQGQGNATSQTATTLPRPTLPTTAAEKASEQNPQVDPAVTREVGKNTPPASDRPTPADDDDAVADADDQDATAAGGTATSASDSAAQTNMGKGNWWSDTDGDSDGRISRTEAESNAGLDSRFASIDADGDGFVTRDEYSVFYKASVSQGAEHAEDHSAVVTRDLWSRFDADADGRLSATEIELDTRLKADFDAIDADDDGFVSDAEYRAYYRGQ